MTTTTPVESRLNVRSGRQISLSRALLAGAMIAAIATVGTSQPPATLGTQPTPPDAAPAQALPASGLVPGSFYTPIPGKTGPAARVGAAGEIIGFTNSDASGTQTITLVHTGKSWMAVYHIDRSGTIRLVSSRPIDSDFSLQLNATSPLPDEIREMGGKTR